MILQGIRRIDAAGRETKLDLSVGPGDERLDARGLIALPGLVDLHAHLREPGHEESETIASGAHAALRGGFTTICAMPNTTPAIDSPGLVAEVAARASAARGARVLPVAAITRGRAGTELADLVELRAAGAVAFSDDGDPVGDARLFRSALEYARGLAPILEHSEDKALGRRGVMHEGAVSADLGLPGIPAAAEEAAIARDIALARLTGGRVHLQHVSTAAALGLVRQAKADGIAVTCEVTPHHLSLTDEWVAGSRAFVWGSGRGDRGAPFESSTKVNPPLRPRSDVLALWAGVADGTVDAIATDHAPHASIRKDVELAEAAFGISGLETALAVLLAAIDAGMGTLPAVVRALSSGPARVLGIAVPDDVVVVDPALSWTVTADALRSKGKNTPLLGRVLWGRVVLAAVDGEVRYADEAALKERRRGEALARG